MHLLPTLIFPRAHRQALESALVAPAASAVEPLWAPIAVRLGNAQDRPALERLAALDSAERPIGEALIASISDRPVAALSLADGSVLADPFTRTRDVVELLRLRARQLRVP